MGPSTTSALEGGSYVGRGGSERADRNSVLSEGSFHWYFEIQVQCAENAEAVGRVHFERSSASLSIETHVASDQRYQLAVQPCSERALGASNSR